MPPSSLSVAMFCVLWPALLRAGNNISTVRSWLGHVSVVTTDHYTEVDAEMKRQALEKTEALATPKRVPLWKRDKDLLAWLEAL